MKILLSILLFIFAPVLTEQGLQIGELNINNQKIKIMKMNLNNPAFLQSASNTKREDYDVKMIFKQANSGMKISSSGEISVTAIISGVATTTTYSEPLSSSVVYFNNDANTPVYIKGDVRTLYTGEMGSYPGSSITYFDCSKSSLKKVSFENARELEFVALCSSIDYCNIGSTKIKSLDLSSLSMLDTILAYNTYELEYLNISNSTVLEIVRFGSNNGSADAFAYKCIELSIPNEQAKSSIILSIEDSVITGSPTLLIHSDYGFNEEVAEAATAKGWTVEYVDAA